MKESINWRSVGENALAIILVSILVGLAMYWQPAKADTAVIGQPTLEPALLYSPDGGPTLICRLRATNPTPPQPYVPLSCALWVDGNSTPMMFNNQTGEIWMDAISL